jgi:hypothetical protein
VGAGVGAGVDVIFYMWICPNSTLSIFIFEFGF